MNFSPEEKAARRTLRLLGVALFVAVLGVAVSGTVRLVRGGAKASTGQGRPASVSTPGPEGSFREVGPLPGQDLAAYTEERSRDLAGAPGERVAVISLRRYTTEVDARAQAPALTVLALLAAAPGGEPAVVTATMAQWAEERRRSDRSESEEIRRLLPTVDDPAFKSFYESELARLDKAVRTIDPNGDVVFGLVVRGPVAGLRTLGGSASVRLVDIAGSAKAAEPVTYRGIRPEELTKAGQPATRPSGADSGAS